MGMYTGLRLKATVKEEYRHIVRGIMDQNNEAKEWRDFAEEYPFLERYASEGRAMFIPFGGLSYMPDEWDPQEHIAAGTFEHQFNEETGYWAFYCSLKNYEDEIGTFLTTVAPILLESSEHVEVLYEEWRRGELYEMRSGHLDLIGHTEHTYNDHDEEEERQLSDWYTWQQGEEG